MLQCLPFVFFPPPAPFLSYFFVPFFSFFFSFFSRLPRFVSLSVCSFLLFAICFLFLLCFVVFLFVCLFFCVLNSRVCMFVFWFSSLFYTPRVACEPAICENLRILSCVSFLAFLLDLNFFFSLFPFDCCFFHSNFFTSSCFFHPVYFFWVVCGLLGFCGDLYSVPHVSDPYMRGPHFLFLV